MTIEACDPLAVLREETAAYLAGEWSLAEFHDWFMEETWDIHLWAPKAVQDLAYALKLRLYEYTSGSWPEDDLKRILREELAKS